MRNQTIKVAAAFSLICITSFTSVLSVEASSNNRPLSENCKQAVATADSVAMTVPKIVCHEELRYDEAIRNFLSQTDKSSDPQVVESNRPKHPAPRHHNLNAERPPSTKPKKGAKLQGGKFHKSGKNHFVAPHPAHGRKHPTRRPKAPSHRAKAAGRGQRHGARILSAAAIRDHFYIDIDLRDLSPSQRQDLLAKFDRLLQRMETIAFLNAVQKAEGGDLLRVVGRLRDKSADCQRRIRKLNLSGHPKEQGLPNRCFVRTRKYGLSTAAGLYQIVYYGNWKALHRLLGLKNFSRNGQAYAALELVRSSKVRGGRVGDGLVALVKGDLDEAIRKGTDPWASSPYSRWHGKWTAPILQYARQELRRMGNVQYAKQNFGKFRHDGNS
jgi:muramidase (phage lysozyme)